MPWNDDSNPGPWGAPSSSDQPRTPARTGEPTKIAGPKGGDTKIRPPKSKAGGDKTGENKPGEDKPVGPWADASPPRPPRGRVTPPDLGAAPRRREPQGDGPQVPGPNIDDLTRELRERLGHLFASVKGHALRREAVLGLVGVAVIGWGLSGLYVVQPEEQAVVTRFGQFIAEAGPGLNYHLPAPVEAVEKVSVASVRSLDIGAGGGTDPAAQAPAAVDGASPVTDATATATPGPAADVSSGDLMLTGDENIVDLNFTVQWRVNDAAKFLFGLSDPDTVVKTVAQSAMRELVGKTALQDIMTTGRGQLQTQAASLTQRVLDSYGAGVTIVGVQVRGANPPKEVIPAFREVINAGQDAETAANQANAYRDRVISEAKGDAAKVVQDAQGYQQQSILEAQGDAARFTQLDAEYRRAPAITRQRLYLETMQRVLSASKKVIVDTPKGSTAPIVLPPDIFRHGDATPVPAPTVVQPQRAPQAASPGPGAGGTAQ